jgi:multiple sugar transport system substrate-binding protein
MRKSLLAVMTLLIVISMLLSSCSTGEEATATAVQTGGETVAATPEPQEPSGEKVTLSVEMSVYVEAPHKKAFDLLEARYEELHPNVDIVYYGAPYAEFWDKLTTEIVAGNEACIVQLQGGADRYAQYASLREGETGSFVNLDPFIKGTWMEDGLLDQENLTYNGHYIGLANYAWGTRAVYFRKSLFEEAGINPDEILTNEDFLEAAKKLTKKRDDGTMQYGFGAVLSTHSFVWSEFSTFLQRPASDGIFFPREAEPYTPENVVVNNEANVWACEWWQKMVLEDKVVPPGSYDKAQQRELFWNGTAAMNIDGPWFVGMTRDRGAETGEDLLADLGVFATPDVLYKGEKKPMYGTVGGITHLISSNCSNVDEAWAFMEWMASEEGQKIVAVSGMVPQNKEVMGSEWYIEEYPLNADVWDFLTSRYRLPPMTNPKIAQMGELQRIMVEASQETFITGADCQQTYDNAAEEIKKILTK